MSWEHKEQMNDMVWMFWVWGSLAGEMKKEILRIGGVLG